MFDTYRVVWLRENRALVGLQVWQGDALMLDTTASDDAYACLDSVLAIAMEYERRVDKLPSDAAVIEAFNDHWA